MKILVTGATGFIGRYVIKELLKTNHEIIATSRDIEKAKEFDWFEKVEYIVYDLNEKKDNLFEFFKKPDVLIHLAWENLPNHQELFHIEKNLFENYHFIKNLVQNGLKIAVVIGTGIEAQNENCYALAKDSLRKFLEELRKKEEFVLKWIRVHYVYGKGQYGNSLIPSLERSIKQGDKVFKLQNPNDRKNFVPVEKVAKKIVEIMEDEKEGVFDASADAVSVKDFVEDYVKKIGGEIEIE